MMGNNLSKKEKIMLSLEQIISKVDDLHGTSLLNSNDEITNIYKKLTQLAYNIDKYLIEKK